MRTPIFNGSLRIGTEDYQDGIDATSSDLAIEHAVTGIRINVMAPGPVNTPLLRGIPADFLKSLAPLTALF